MTSRACGNPEYINLACWELCWVIFHAFKNFQEHYQSVKLFDLDQDKPSVLICIQTVCKGYHQQMTKVTASKEITLSLHYLVAELHYIVAEK